MYIIMAFKLSTFYVDNLVLNEAGCYKWLGKLFSGHQPGKRRQFQANEVAECWSQILKVSSLRPTQKWTSLDWERFISWGAYGFLVQKCRPTFVQVLNKILSMHFISTLKIHQQTQSCWTSPKCPTWITTNYFKQFWLAELFICTYTIKQFLTE